MTIYTSYYANYRNFPIGLHPVCISLWPPRGYRGDRKLELAPVHDLLMDINQGKITHEEYGERYKLQLQKLDVRKVAIDCQGCILLCYEKTGDFCHRHLVADWLRAAGYEVQELPNAKKANAR